MDTGQDKQVAQLYLLEEVRRTRELARALENRIQDVFVKTGQIQVIRAEDEAPPRNPIDYAIATSQLTQDSLKECCELLEQEIINKLVGP